MGRLSRTESCSDHEINVVHCINRCVRRGFLCGQDAVTGNHQEHRREWILAHIEFLAGAMGVEVLGYAIMSNHFHLVLRNRPGIMTDWSDDEIAVRCWTLCPALFTAIKASLPQSRRSCRWMPSKGTKRN